jgi:deoxyribodipyrimidine photo-lyase
MTHPSIVWFRHDLRLFDNPALCAAVETGRPIIALYILDDDSPGDWRAGSATRWWLHHSLTSLANRLKVLGAPLILRRGRAEYIIENIVDQTKAKHVFWNRLYEPWSMRRDSFIKNELKLLGVTVQSFNGSLLFEPSDLRTKQGESYRVFTPFWRACLAADPPQKPLAAPKSLKAFADVEGDKLEDWSLLPVKPDWAKNFNNIWRVGEAAAQESFKSFIKSRINSYKLNRDIMSKNGVSKLSPHLHFGEISARHIWWETISNKSDGAACFLRELGWREFCHHLLACAPQMPTEPLDKRFINFPWRQETASLHAWRRGQTGYPLVDAAMRQLWQTGYIHNRSRMVAASFLVKHLLHDWRIGAEWFWDTLVDADLANNSGGWQWVSGCGADAAPYFRVFNPVIQGEKFDPDGLYVRQFIPELSKLDNRYIHRPWEAPAEVLQASGIELGKTYPFPIIDHKFARERALEAFATTRILDQEA